MPEVLRRKVKNIESSQTNHNCSQQLEPEKGHVLAKSGRPKVITNETWSFFTSTCTILHFKDHFDVAPNERKERKGEERRQESENTTTPTKTKQKNQTKLKKN